MNDENTIDLDPTETVTDDDFRCEGSWNELEEDDAKVLLPLIKKIGGDGTGGIVLTRAELKDSIAYAFMAGTVLEQADMMSQLFAVAGMDGMMATMMEVDDDDGPPSPNVDDEIGGGTGGSGLH